MNEVINYIKENNLGKVEENISLSKLTTYKCGGTLRALIQPVDIESLIKVLKKIKELNIKHKILGMGSNVVFSNKDYEGIIIKLTNFKKCLINEDIIECEAGHSLISLALKAADKGLTGLEFASGIPGSLGGAIFMNAGAYKSDMGYIVTKVKVLDENYNIIELSNKDMNFHYRTSYLKESPNLICLGVTIKLKKGDEKQIKELMKDRTQRRKESQPLDYPSAGSVFRNHDDIPAWRLIENVGLKETSIGGAIISKKHANFILNKGDATGEDIKALIELIKQKVYEEYNINLILEQELVNF